jgi:ParB-like chromosome segregation protein Spo0J
VKVAINKIKPNPKNPRVIRDDKFAKLVKSIQDFPEMLEKRPLVCFTDIDGKYVVLGGNMRLKAANEVGLKQLPILLADDWTEEQKEMFLYRDNISAGSWEWETVSEWGKEELKDWGEVEPKWAAGLDVNNMTDDDVNLDEEFDPIGNMSGKQRVVFIFDGSAEAESYLNSFKIDFVKRNMAWQVNMCTPSI